MKAFIEYSINKLIRYFMTGLLAVLPLILTVGIVIWVVRFLRDLVGPDTYIGKSLSELGLRLFTEADKATLGGGEGVTEALRGSFLAYLLGIVLVVIGLFVLGVLFEFGAKRFFHGALDHFIAQIPIVGSLYGSLKQLVDLFDKNKEGAEIKAMSVVYCHFAAGAGPGVLALMPSSEKIMINNEEHYIVIIPTSPVPFGGALVFFPVKQVTPSEMSVDSLISIYVSMGVSTPEYMNIAKAK
jgi:uncharacterized membrane protein